MNRRSAIKAAIAGVAAMLGWKAKEPVASLRFGCIDDDGTFREFDDVPILLRESYETSCETMVVEWTSGTPIDLSEYNRATMH